MLTMYLLGTFYVIPVQTFTSNSSSVLIYHFISFCLHRSI